MSDQVNLLDKPRPSADAAVWLLQNGVTRLGDLLLDAIDSGADLGVELERINTGELRVKLAGELLEAVSALRWLVRDGLWALDGGDAEFRERWMTRAKRSLCAEGRFHLADKVQYGPHPVTRPAQASAAT